MKRLVVMHSDLAVPVLAEKLRQSVDLEGVVPYSQGVRPLYGTVTEKTFALYKRPARRSDFTGAFCGTFIPQAKGTRVEAHFDTPIWIRYLTRMSIGVAVLVGFPPFIRAAMNVESENTLALKTLAGLVALPAMILIAALIPTFLRRFGRRDRQYVLNLLQQVTASEVENVQRASK